MASPMKESVQKYTVGAAQQLHLPASPSLTITLSYNATCKKCVVDEAECEGYMYSSIQGTLQHLGTLQQKTLHAALQLCTA